MLVLAFVANRLSRWTRVPDVIVLLGNGILLGPVLHWVDVVRFGAITQGFGTLALILILFAAGLELDLRHALKQFWGAMVLSLLSYGLTLTGITYFCIYAAQDAANAGIAGGGAAGVHQRRRSCCPYWTSWIFGNRSKQS